MDLYSKNLIIDYVWQYSHFYANKLIECEQHYLDGRGYSSLILLFEITENICKSVVGDFDSSFYCIVNELKNQNKITEEEKNFLSTNKFSIRKIRNLYAHANLMSINLVCMEGERIIYYPLTEEKSCLVLYEKVSLILFNLLGKILYGIHCDGLEKEIKTFEIKFKDFSARELLKFRGFSDEDIDKAELVTDSSNLVRLADNCPDIRAVRLIGERIAEFEKNRKNDEKKNNSSL